MQLRRVTSCCSVSCCLHFIVFLVVSFQFTYTKPVLARKPPISTAADDDIHLMIDSLQEVQSRKINRDLQESSQDRSHNALLLQSSSIKSQTTSTTKPPSTSATSAKSHSTTIPSIPALNSTAANRRPGLLTRTTDAIYKALTGYFSHDDDANDDGDNPATRDSSKYGAKLSTPALPTTTSAPRTTPTREPSSPRTSPTEVAPRASTRIPSTSVAAPSKAHKTNETGRRNGSNNSNSNREPAGGNSSMNNRPATLATTGPARASSNASATNGGLNHPLAHNLSHTPPRHGHHPVDNDLRTATPSHDLKYFTLEEHLRATTLPATGPPPTTPPTTATPMTTSPPSSNPTTTPTRPTTAHPTVTNPEATTPQPKTNQPSYTTISRQTSTPHLHLDFSDINYEIAPINRRRNSSSIIPAKPTPTNKRVIDTAAPHSSGTTGEPSVQPTTHKQATTHDTDARAHHTTATPHIFTTTTKKHHSTTKATTIQHTASARPDETHDELHHDGAARHQNETGTTLSSSLHLFSLLRRAFTTISSELTLLNRTTRLTHDTSGDGPDSETGSGGETEREIENTRLESSVVHLAATGGQKSSTSERLLNLRHSSVNGSPNEDELKDSSSGKKQQVSSREDILFLCRLLHKHLGNNSNPTNGTLNDALSLQQLAVNLGQLTSSTERPSGTSTTITTPTTKPAKQIVETSTAAGVNPHWLVRDPRLELTEQSHGGRLLESVFAFETRARGPPAESDGGRKEAAPYEEAALRLLSELYNVGHVKRLLSTGVYPSTGSMEETLDAAGSPIRNISLMVWSKTVTEDRGGRLKLVYWLLERLPTTNRLPNSSTVSFKVLELSDATELLDQLDHSLIQQAISEVALVRPKGVLVAAYKRDLDSSQEPPRVIDDTLQADQTVSSNKSPSTLQLIIDRFSQASFGENLHLYLILFIATLFIIILCIAVPALCCKCMMPAPATAVGRGPRSGGAARRRLRANGGARQTREESSERPRTNFYRSTDLLNESVSNISGALTANRGCGGSGGHGADEGDNNVGLISDGGRCRAPIDQTKQAEAPAIWRKLSNSTTTITKDEIRTIEDGGHFIGLARGDNKSSEPKSQVAPSADKFEWYTFEDNNERTIARGPGALPNTERRTKTKASLDKPTQTVVLRDRCKVTKSVQTYARQDCDAAADGGGGGGGQRTATEDDDTEEGVTRDEHLSLAYRDKLQTRNSNTLTKSELVMLKEKLIPIGQQLKIEQEQQKRREASSSPQACHDYVNTRQLHQTRDQQETTSKPPTRHIDSSSVESSNGKARGRLASPSGRPLNVEMDSKQSSDGKTDDGLRAPSMRYLELPSQTKNNVDAIKSELDKLVARDQATTVAALRQASPYSSKGEPGGTYQRYDVI